ncbi:MAG TPA: ABC transporter permease subunit [Nitrolancea sp.]|jgi:phosphonate transport system permease protein|nr:ABC transporter permease subunit [Nitrolancea sp.]
MTSVEGSQPWLQPSSASPTAIEDLGDAWDRTAGGGSSPDFSAPITRLTTASVVMRGLLLLLAATTAYALITMDTRGVDILKAVGATFDNLKIILLQPNTTRLSLWDAFSEVGLTMGMAFLTTVISAIISVFLGLLGAQNLAPKRVTLIVKGAVALVRAVPTILWVLIFAVAAGLGSTAAVIGLTFHSVSYLTKAYSESFEEIDTSVIEALKASGANWWQIVSQAVIPSSITYLLSWTFLRLEINFANAVAMGAAAGAAGIGFDLFMASGFYFDLHELGLITYFILIFAIALELLATNMKRRLEN